ncbi:hypothetical protein M0805_008854 [Coniferiporia weirii]|nr:hypothetical protein M0805_008854 [Coniferiporia weirii]
MLWDLNIDIMTQIFTLLDVEDILSLRLTSRHFSSLTRLRTIWYDALVRHVLSQDIPVPRSSLAPGNGNDVSFSRRGLASLSAVDLERATCTALSAEKNWWSKKPVRVRERNLNILEDMGFSWSVQFLRIRTAATDEEVEEGRYLLIFGGKEDRSLRVWDIESTDEGADDGIRLAGVWWVAGHCSNMAVDEGNGMREPSSCMGLQDARGALISISVHHDVHTIGEITETITSYELYILRFTPHSSLDPYSNFDYVKQFDIERPLYVLGLCGRFIALQIEEEGGRDTLKVVDWVRSTVIFSTGCTRDNVAHGHDPNSEVEVSVELVPSADEKDYVSSVRFVHDWVLVFRQSILELYFVPPSALRSYSAKNGNRAPILRPAVVHKYMENIDLAQIGWSAVTERVSWASERAASQCTVCHGQGYVDGEDVELWPAVQGNDRSKHRGRDEDEMIRRIVCTCRYRPLSLTVLFGERGTGESQLQHHVLHVPDSTAPVLMHAFRINNAYSEERLALGRFGTLFSIDEARHRWDSDEEDVDIEETTLDSSYGDNHIYDRVSGRFLPLPSQFEDTMPPPSPLEPDEGFLFLPMESRVTMSVFERRWREVWYTVALCERARRIALGHPNGWIELWDYI